MSVRVAAIKAREVLDSRGRPTVEASVALTDGTIATASVPAGMSRSSYEAVELRDGDHARYGGLGVQRAVANVNQTIADALLGHEAHDQAGVDASLIALDGTVTKSNIGANALLAVSLATARAAASSLGVPLWRHLANRSEPHVLPVPMVNIISGGLHAGGNVDFQDFLIIPVGATSFSQALQMSVDVYASTREVLSRRGLSVLKADEGGFGPALAGNAAALDLLLEAVERTGYVPGTEIAFAIDVAASHFYDALAQRYDLASEGRVCAANELVELLATLTETYPIISIEDGLSEDDWDGWQHMTSLLGDQVQLVGDDLFSTNLERLERGIARGAGNAILVKMNQIGTLSETMAVANRAAEAGFRPVISARSGDTEDHALADLAVAMNAGQIKIGSVAQSERLAKYNQLLRIEEELGDAAVFDPTGILRGAPGLKEPLA